MLPFWGTVVQSMADYSGLWLGGVRCFTLKTPSTTGNERNHFPLLACGEGLGVGFWGYIYT
jgi:hypothetical protein